jgi:hypothetical protein
MVLKLKVGRLDELDIRKGIIRIEEYSRNKFESGSLIILHFNDKSIPVRLFGLNKINKDNNTIYLDEPTRKKIGLNDYNFKEKKEISFLIEKPNSIKKILITFKYYFNHPDFITRYSIKVGIFSYFFAVLALILSIIQMLSSDNIIQIIFGSFFIILFILLILFSAFNIKDD